MERHHRLPKKLGMSLIELLVVITIIGILIGVLVPTIGNTQGRTRDVTRQTQVQELAAALMSYKLDYGEFPPISQSLTIGTENTEQYRGDISMLNYALIEGGYMTKIPKDPANLSFFHPKNELSENEKFEYKSNGYYLYMSNGKSFAIITLVEDEKNGNARAGTNGSDLILKLTTDTYNDIFNGTIQNNFTGGNLYVYKYEEETL